MKDRIQPGEVSRHPDAHGDEGYMLLAAVVMIFMVLLWLSVAAPKVAMELKRDREIETQHRANQYVRAIRVYYRKTGHYPGSVEQLLNTNNQKFLRQKYLDPMTGKDDWKLIMVGQNKTTVKGFFGEDLPGMAGGLGAAAGMASSNGSAPTTGSSFGSGNTGSSFGAGSSFGSGSGNGPAGGINTGGTSTGTTGTGSGTSGMGEQNATDFTGGSTGPIMGVGVSKSGQGFLSVNGEDQYENWEFLYDPRIEQLYAKGNLLGGGGVMSGGTGSGAFPSSGTSSGFPGTNTPGSGSGTGTGSSGGGSGSGSGSTPPATPQ
jgi:type II secretory pathway pseudopilin PulG